MASQGGLTPAAQPGGRSPEQVAEMLRKENVVMEWRRRGKTFHWIEKETGWHNCDRIFARAIARDENAPARREEAIRLEDQRLDAMQDGLWDDAMAGNARAIEVMLKLLERRARLHGLDFADMVSGRMAEVEQAKVRLMATALVRALQDVDMTSEQRRAATRRFMEELRAVNAESLPPPEVPAYVPGEVVRPALSPADEDLL